MPSPPPWSGWWPSCPGGGEARLGQREMADAVRLGIAERKHVAVQAGTGTGKTLAYLVPAILSGRRTVVATATKALQDQLAGKDLPFLEQHLDHPFAWAVLKGRSNYLCMQRLDEVVATGQDDGQLALDGVAERAPAEELLQLSTWAATSATGDRAELEVEPSERAWSAVSVSARECPGAARCPSGGICFAEAARNRALRGRRRRGEPPPLRARPGHGRACSSRSTSSPSSTRPTSSRTSCRPPAASSSPAGASPTSPGASAA